MGDIEYRNTTALLDAILAASKDIDAIADDAEDWWACTGKGSSSP